MKKNIFIELIKEARFREMFITEMGWNNYRGQAELPLIDIDGLQYQFVTVAERNGFQVLTCEVDDIPTASVCKRIDTKLRRSANDYIAIYIKRGTEHHQWVAPVRNVDKRDLVTIEYENAVKADFVFSKIDGLTFGNSEHTTIVDVKERIQGTFAVNSEKITKDFYAGFKKEHNAFAQFISGIDDTIELKNNRNKQWYTSVMLNRLMFCYFIQKKGFLDSNVNYLRDKLKWCQDEKGENRFFKSFYQGFLMQLFQDGLNSPTHNRDFETVYGRIPYLNGGMFDRHQIEQDYQDIDIADEAFEHLFEFFDKWRWHLDTRISASGKDINPDVLGYIFEQYINDRTQMGAYYTKEDITEYIGRNCILPFLMDKVKDSTQEMGTLFMPKGFVWQMLKKSDDKYIFNAVKQGYTPDWKSRIPANIAEGIDTAKPNLLERRKDWNNKTSEPWALPTEIWRETIERLQRCETILGKIQKGEISQINDFITYNLDVRSFVGDLLATADNHRFIGTFYHALQKVTILDPTCGSGAFLFAAMNILEPLYEVCIDRMMECNSQNPNLFKDEIGEIKNRYRSNIQYFIYKSIILRNLYGVDIMQEATEIAKLRLFLKMVAVVEVDRRAPNLGLDPLPDIDFNVRCGNTLVGYATEDEIVAGTSYADMFTQQEFREKVETEMEKVSKAYEIFRTQQLADHDNLESVKAAKAELKERLSKLTDLLDRQLFSSSGGASFEAWKESYQPFHWIAEYYQIIQGNGGFDVIIGNPPYVEYSKVRHLYVISNFSTINTGNLYSFVIERSFQIIADNKYLGMIIPISAFCTNRMESMMRLIQQNSLMTFISNYAERPGKLFEGAERNLSIILSKILSGNRCEFLYTTYYYKWKAENRNILFNNISYFNSNEVVLPDNFPKISSLQEFTILKKLRMIKSNIGLYCQRKSNYIFYYKNSGGRYWKFMANFKPLFYLNGVKGTSSRETHLFFEDENHLKVFTSILNSTLYYWYYIMHSDARTNNPSDLKNFPIQYEAIESSILNELEGQCDILMKELQENSLMVDAVYRTGNVSFAQYLPAKSKRIIDNIDLILSKQFGFNEDELDFIINYDIKYRMGDELNNEEED